ncbi:hypothetical protein T12_1118 [Trichinella patagoniensis]|uniref:Uncharacterized protein n=1 Tax=Trichinella patagoniensis TaxID=990121 RepID=A0A0V0ZCU1_9BILA|nr:hypothetical protein T12_1118 [Trichinella patagoniensis]
MVVTPRTPGLVCESILNVCVVTILFLGVRLSSHSLVEYGNMVCGHTSNVLNESCSTSNVSNRGDFTLNVSNESGTPKKSWNTEKIRPAYIRESVVTP